MIKIKANYDLEKEYFSCTYNAKKTNTMENVCLIEDICQHILENNKDSDMTIDKIFEIVKEISKTKEEI